MSCTARSTRYFGGALFVAFLSWGTYYAYKEEKLRLPDWWYEARMPSEVELLDVAERGMLLREELLEARLIDGLHVGFLGRYRA